MGESAGCCLSGAPSSVVNHAAGDEALMSVIYCVGGDRCVTDGSLYFINCLKCELRRGMAAPCFASFFN